MDFNNYQFRASQTAVYPQEKALEYLSLGLVSEAGEVAGKVKKLIRDNDSQMTEENREQLILEIGDVLWYVAQLCTTLKENMGAVAQKNADKLSARKSNNTIHGSGDNR